MNDVRVMLSGKGSLDDDINTGEIGMNLLTTKPILADHSDVFTARISHPKSMATLVTPPPAAKMKSSDLFVGNRGGQFSTVVRWTIWIGLFLSRIHPVGDKLGKCEPYAELAAGSRAFLLGRISLHS